LELLGDYNHRYFYIGSKPGYSGTAILSKIKPLAVSYGIGVVAHDEEGRTITAEFDDFYLVNCYVPNSGQGLKRLEYRLTWDTAFENYLKSLDAKKPVVLTGDLNVAHQEIDIANPKANRKSAGFTDEERAGFTHLLAAGFIDSFRHFNPTLTGAYTFWSMRGNVRQRNIGWRLDYFVVSQRLIDSVSSTYMRHLILGSDHCPIGLILKTSTEIPTADEAPPSSTEPVHIQAPGETIISVTTDSSENVIAIASGKDLTTVSHTVADAVIDTLLTKDEPTNQ